MEKNEFVTLLVEKLQLKGKNLTPETRFDSLNEWDSWAKLDLMTMVDERFNLTLTADDISKIETINDLIDKIGIDKINE